ncbi:MAG: endonuclease/exonuclease/phosphatase family protein [Candidatus Promineifilaceae bacterium]
MKALTWNIAFGQPEKLDRLYAVLAAAQADVITLNEADHESTVIELAQRLGMTHVWARGSGDRHVATLSRYPILRWQIYNRKPLTQAALATTLDVRPDGVNPLTVFNVHFRPNPYWHFELFRFLAANALLSAAKREKAQTSLIMGDLNTYGQGDPVDVKTILRFMRPQDRKTLQRQRYKFLRISLPRLLRGGYADCYRDVHPNEAGYTFTRHGHPVSRMDYVLADKLMRMRLRSCELLAGDLNISDHFPLLTEFQ